MCPSLGALQNERAARDGPGLSAPLDATMRSVQARLPRIIRRDSLREALSKRDQGGSLRYDVGRGRRENRAQ
jgi:hypothetical protein